MAGTLVFSRESEEDIKIRGLEIYVDDQFAADLHFGKQMSHPVAPGEHQVKVTNSLYTKKMDVTVADGETVRFDVGNYITGLGGMMFAAIGMGPYKVFLRRV